MFPLKASCTAIISAAVAFASSLLVIAQSPSATVPATRPADTAPAATREAIPFVREARPSVTRLPIAPIIPATVEDLKKIQARVEAVAREVMPATVAILMDGTQGSGVIVSRDGYVLTAGHVSGKPGASVRVILADGRSFKAKSLGANNGIDSGMVKISDPAFKGEFPFVPVGTARKLAAGQWVVAIGHPGGYRRDRPPVVRLGRVLLANSRYIGTDSPLISGDSGGPVFDLDGKLIGINSRIGMTTNANIHVPIDTFVDTWDRLAKGEEWGNLTSMFDDSPRAAAALGANVRDDESNRVVVRVVHPGSAADKGGLQKGDVILRFKNKPVKSAEDLAAIIAKCRPNETVTIDVLRDAKEVAVTAKLGLSGR